jgi:hypothetical protein
MSKLLLNILAFVNVSEGVIHLLTSAVSFWGMFSLGVFDWRVATSPTADLLLGMASLITGLVLRCWGRGGQHGGERHQCFGTLTAISPTVQP